MVGSNLKKIFKMFSLQNLHLFKINLFYLWRTLLITFKKVIGLKYSQTCGFSRNPVNCNHCYTPEKTKSDNNKSLPTYLCTPEILYPQFQSLSYGKLTKNISIN